ncbi:MAG: amidohydrolase family protein [Bryobacteraceae bacterium]|jgi:predicted TIM-barrel fold metal-dependent hydrolase
MNPIKRDSPWGPIAVSDAHVHFFSYAFFEKLAAQKPGLTIEAMQAQLGWHMPPTEPAQLAALWAQELDKHGVAHAALIASAPGDEASVEAAARAFPDRFFAYSMVDPSRGWRPAELAAIRAVCLFPAMHRYSVQSAETRRVFDWAEQERRTVFVHCGVLSVGVRRKLGLDSPFDMRFSNPIDLQSVALRYPTVPIVVPHFGAGYFRETLMLADLCPNVYLDTSSSNRWMLYQASNLNLRQVFHHALSVVGPKRLLFGSDSSYFPRGWHQQIFEEQARALYELDLSMGDARSIFSENLLRIISG